MKRTVNFIRLTFLLLVSSYSFAQEATYTVTDLGTAYDVNITIVPNNDANNWQLSFDFLGTSVHYVSPVGSFNHTVNGQNVTITAGAANTTLTAGSSTALTVRIVAYPVDPSPVSNMSFTYDGSSGGGGFSGDIWEESNLDVTLNSQLTGNVGIGTATPSAKLEVNGNVKATGLLLPTGAVDGYIMQTDASGNVSWIDPSTLVTSSQWTTIGSDIYFSTGSVGIGNSSPTQALDVTGNIQASGVLTALTGRFSMAEIGSPISSRAYFYHKDVTTPINDFAVQQLVTGRTILNSAGGQPLYFRINNEDKMTLAADGKIGIGTTTPSEALDVVGNISTSGDLITSGNLNTNSLIVGSSDPMPAGYIVLVDGKMAVKEVRVSFSKTWGDFVFDDSYELMELDSLNEYVAENKHLPEIPDAKQMNGEGGELGELTRLQMIKIEELTLYILELNEKIKALEEEVTELKN